MKRKKKKNACSPEEEAAEQEASGQEHDEATRRDGPDAAGAGGNRDIRPAPHVVFANAGNPRSPSTPVSEEWKLVIRAQRSDQRAFDALVRRYQGSIYQLCFWMLGNREDAQDQTQETLLRLYRKLDKLDPARGISPRTYILKIARRCCINLMRKPIWEQQKKQLALEGTGNDADDDALALLEKIPQDSYPDPQRQLEKEELHRAVRSCRLELTSCQKSVLYLRFFEEKTFQEIATLGGRTSTNGPSTALDRALRQLRICLRTHGFDPTD